MRVGEEIGLEELRVTEQLSERKWIGKWGNEDSLEIRKSVDEFTKNRKKRRFAKVQRLKFNLDAIAEVEL